MRSFSRQRILITGGSSGIGLETAREFSRRGARVVLLARDAAKLELAADSCEGEARWVSCDVTDAQALGVCFRETGHADLRIDYTAKPVPPLETADAAWAAELPGHPAP